MSLFSLFRHHYLIAGLLAFCALVFPPTVSADWPDKPITFVVGFGVGGSADRTARAMATFLPDELGQPVLVVNKPGAGSRLAAEYVLNFPDDCNTLLWTALTPYFTNTILTGGAPYSIDDFAYINGQWNDWDVLLVNKDTQFSTLKDLIDTIKSKPRTVRQQLIYGGSNHLNTLLLLEALDIPRDHVNIVPYEGGGKARAALAGGVVDFGIDAAEGSVGIADFVRPLAVFRENKHKIWDAPPINEALRSFGVTMPIVSGSMRGVATSAACKRARPDRFLKLVAAVQNTLERKDVQKFLKRSGVGGEFLGPDKTTQRVKQQLTLYKKYAPLMKE